MNRRSKLISSLNGSVCDGVQYENEKKARIWRWNCGKSARLLFSLAGNMKKLRWIVPMSAYAEGVGSGGTQRKEKLI